MCYNILAYFPFGAGTDRYGESTNRKRRLSMEEKEEEKKIAEQNEDETDLPEKRDFEEELLAIIKSDEPPQQIAEKLED